MKILVEISRVRFGLDTGHWSQPLKERFPTSFVMRLGPFFFYRKMPFCREAAGRLFENLNRSGVPIREFADAKRRAY